MLKVKRIFSWLIKFITKILIIVIFQNYALASLHIIYYGNHSGRSDTLPNNRTQIEFEHDK